MKLGSLNSAIRKAPQVVIPVYFANGKKCFVKVQKTHFVECLQDAYDKERATETEMEVSEDGEIRGLLLPVIDQHGSPAAEVDLDDLMGCTSEVELEDLGDLDDLLS